MIYFKLVAPIFTHEQVNKIVSKNSNVDELTLKKLAGYAAGICTKDTENYKKGEIIPNCITQNTDIYIGADAAVWYCKECGIYDVKPIVEINIPIDVYSHCTERQWMGICKFAADVEQRNNRCRRLVELKAPDLILANEFRTLRDYIYRLEYNPDCFNGGSETWSDGIIIRSLNDIGYSLADGWSDIMKQAIAKETEEFRNTKEEEKDHE